MLILCIPVYLRLPGNGDLSMKHIEGPSLCITSNFQTFYSPTNAHVEFIKTN